MNSNVFSNYLSRSIAIAPSGVTPAAAPSRAYSGEFKMQLMRKDSKFAVEACYCES